jgi:hypothetical protein
MPTNRVRRSRPRIAETITAEAITAWQVGDFHALNRALGIPPCHPSPFPRDRTALGCSQDEKRPVGCTKVWWDGLERAQALQQEFYRVAGEPGIVGRHGKPMGPAK